MRLRVEENMVKGFHFIWIDDIFPPVEVDPLVQPSHMRYAGKPPLVVGAHIPVPPILAFDHFA